MPNNNLFKNVFKQQENHDGCSMYVIVKHWLCGNSCTWAHDVPLHTVGTNEPRVPNNQNKEHNITTTNIMLLVLLSTLCQYLKLLLLLS